MIDGSRDTIARCFGFAQALEQLDAGGWQGPIASAYGLHLVWIDARSAPQVEPLAAVRGRVVHGLLRERGEERARARLAVLRCHFGLGADCAS